MALDVLLQGPICLLQALLAAQPSTPWHMLVAAAALLHRAMGNRQSRGRWRLGWGLTGAANWDDLNQASAMAIVQRVRSHRELQVPKSRPALLAERKAQAKAGEQGARQEAIALQAQLDQAQAQVAELTAQLAAATIAPPAAAAPEVASVPPPASPAPQLAAAATQTTVNDVAEEPADVAEEEPPLPLPPGVQADGFGLYPRPMVGGNNVWVQFRRHFRTVSASLYRMLHRNASDARISIKDLTPLEGETALRCAQRAGSSAGSRGGGEGGA